MRPERSLASPPAPLHPRDLLFLPSTGALVQTPLLGLLDRPATPKMLAQGLPLGDGLWGSLSLPPAVLDLLQ